jgi:DNA-binding CsgD family transcriptional regulator
LKTTENKIEKRAIGQASEIEHLNQQLLIKDKCSIEEAIERNKVIEELLKANRTISVLESKLAARKQDYKRKVSEVVCTRIIPIVELLKNEQNLEHLSPVLEMLEFHCSTLSQKGMTLQPLLAKLTDTEVKVAAMVKNGLSTKNIAERLFISYETAKSHRKNIRKKLKINKSNINLSTHLKSIM